MAENQREKRGRLFRKAVKSLGLDSPVTEISDKLLYDKGNLSKILNNKTQPSTTLVKSFQRAYNINIEDFDVPNEKTPPEGTRFEDLIASKVMEGIMPILDQYADDFFKAIGNLQIELNLIKQKQSKLEEMQKDCNKVQGETLEYIKHK